MPGAATLAKAMRGRAASAAEVNGLLRAIRAEVGNAYHVWVRRDRWGDVEGAPSRRKVVSDGALAAWDRACFVLRLVPYRLRRDKWQTDEESVRLLHELAAHPADPVRVPAAVALGLLSQVPPLAALEGVLAQARAGDLHQYAHGCLCPRWWVRPCVHYRAVRWERLCGDVARAAYGPENVLTQFAGETLSVDGLIPDVIIGAVERDRRNGRIVRAETIIEAKSGQLPHRHTYAHLCDRLEYWHGGINGERVRRHSGDPPCEIVYRDRPAVADLAPTDDLRQAIEDYGREDGQYLLYLRFLQDCAVAGVGLEDVERIGALEQPDQDDEGTQPCAS